MNSSMNRFPALACGIALVACMVSGCTPAPVRVEPQQYEPPRVDCQQQATPDVPAWPVLWFLDGPAFTIEVLGLLTQERELRGVEQECVGRLKAKGVIR